MDRIRQESHANCIQTKADWEHGRCSVLKALLILRDYYGSSAASASMLQSGNGIGELMQQPTVQLLEGQKAESLERQSKVSQSRSKVV